MQILQCGLAMYETQPGIFQKVHSVNGRCSETSWAARIEQNQGRGVCIFPLSFTLHCPTLDLMDKGKTAPFYAALLIG